MYQLDQALPTWTAALEPVGLLWKNNSSICEPSQQDSAHAHASLLTSQLSAAPVGTNAAWPDSSRGPESGQVQLGAAAKQHQMWEPVPAAPDNFRDEVLNLFSANSEGTAPEPEPTKQEFTHSAPSSSGFTNGTEKDCSKQLDSSAISRTRSQPNTSEQKQANARESQKRFRARQKVCKCADEQHVCVRLDIKLRRCISQTLSGMQLDCCDALCSTPRCCLRHAPRRSRLSLPALLQSFATCECGSNSWKAGIFC